VGKVIAVRVLSYFRDKKNLSLFKKILDEETFPQVLFAAGFGVALCKDTSSFRTVAVKLWNVSGHNQALLLIFLNIFGKSIASDAHKILSEEQLLDEGKLLLTKFLSDSRHKEAMPTIVRMLHSETSSEVLASCLNALRYLGDDSILNEVLPFLGHKDDNLRIEALHAITQTDKTVSLRHIERGLSDENWQVRREAALAMSEMGKIGISRLKAIAGERNEASQFAAKGILSELQFGRITVENF
jgi:hypothetical protein